MLCLHFTDDECREGSANLIFVDCPNQLGPGIIRGEAGWFLKKARLTSLIGTYYREWDVKKWMGPVYAGYNRFCPFCSVKFEFQKIEKEKYRSDLPKFYKHKCSNCGKESELEITWYRGDIHTPGCDPFFGLPLYLREPVKGEMIWFYNKDHMNYIKAYVEADLRNRVTDGKWTIITRLPNWMKDGKNRGRILKAIAKLEKKYLSLKVAANESARVTDPITPSA